MKVKIVIAAAVIMGFVSDGAALAQSCSAYPNTLQNGSTADATQVMANFNCAALVGAAHFTGNVGIGTATPIVPLDLNSSLQTIKLAVFSDTHPWETYGIGIAPSEMTFGASITPTGTPQMVLTSAGYLGIGTTAPSYPLYVNGTVYATGGAGALSDVRHKTDIATLPPGSLRIVDQIRPVTFRWKQPADDGMKGEQIGFIAQEMAEILPDVVMTDGNAEKTMGIKYDQIIPVLVAAIQEQQAQIKLLAAKVMILERRR